MIEDRLDIHHVENLFVVSSGGLRDRVEGIGRLSARLLQDLAPRMSPAIIKFEHEPSDWNSFVGTNQDMNDIWMSKRW